MSEAPDHSHVASNGRADLSLDELAALHGGFAHFMVEVSDRATRCYQAAQAKNRLVALHQIGELTKVLKLSALVRPQYGEAIEQFIAEDLRTLRTIIDNEEWDHFEESWETLTAVVNQNHERFDHGYLVWRVPKNASSDLDLTPPASL